MRWVDPYILALLAAMALGFLLPAQGNAVMLLAVLTKAAVALLFFLQGVRLQKAAIIEGATHWRLQLLTLFCTFAVYPLLGLMLFVSIPGAVGATLWPGVLYLCALPSTVQSSIALTSIARGNVPAAVCAATASNLAGVVLTPLLVSAALNLPGSGSPSGQIQSVVLQLLVPFVAGQGLSRWLRPWVQSQAKVLSMLDRGSILLVVYTSFSAAVLAGTWEALGGRELAMLLMMSVVLLIVALAFIRCASWQMKFSREDASAAIFCGSNKSLATGVPMANILFPAATVGLVILPVMIFHQLQLIVCSVIARRYARRTATDDK
jgi:sodium/bile acid cotransporter 7